MREGLTCPLGHTCDKCLWYVTRVGRKGDSEPEAKTQCAILWIGDLQISNIKESNAMAAAVESFRNEMVKGNRTLMTVLNGADPLRLTGD